MKFLKKISASTEIVDQEYDVVYYNSEDSKVTLKKTKETPTVETVDLGLPSGTKWMKYNIGSITEEGYGKYFQWGDTVGYEDASHSTWATCPFNDGNSSYSLQAWASHSASTVTVDSDGNYNLNTEYDAAYVATDGAAHMPTNAQWQELTANTTTAWTQVNSVNGVKFTSKSDTSKYVFFPAAGCAYDGSLGDQGDYAGVWSSTVSTDNPSSAWFMLAYDGDVCTAMDTRCDGYSVRGVVG